VFAAGVHSRAQVGGQEVVTVAFGQLCDLESAAARALGTVNVEGVNGGGQVAECSAVHSPIVLWLQTLVLSTLWEPICMLDEGLLSRPLQSVACHRSLPTENPKAVIAHDAEVVFSQLIAVPRLPPCRAPSQASLFG
jgi:hypothetical protein